MERTPIVWLGGAVAGAALVYWLDPVRGGDRRSRVKNKAIHAGHEAADAIGVVGRDVRNRGRGLFAEMRRKFAGEGPVDDATLEARVRTQLGRVCSHPGAIDVI